MVSSVVQRSRRARSIIGSIAAIGVLAGAVAGCAAAPPPPPCPDALIEFYGLIGAPQTTEPDRAIYPASAPAVSCSFYFEPQNSTSIVIVDADRADFDAVYAALEQAGYDLGEATERADPAPGDAHVRADLNGGPATGVLLLVEPDPTAGFDSVSVVMLAVPTP